MDFHYHTAGLSRTSATSEVKLFVIIMRWSSAVGYRHKELHIRCFLGPKSASSNLPMKIVPVFIKYIDLF